MPPRPTTKKQSKDDDDIAFEIDETVSTSNDDNIGGLSTALVNMRLQTQTHSNYYRLKLASAANPFDIVVVKGPRRKTDDGQLFCNSLTIVIPNDSMEDIDDITLELDAENETDGDGNSSLLVLTRPITSVARIQSMDQMLAGFNIDLKDHYAGHKVVATKELDAAHHFRLQAFNSSHAKCMHTGEDKIQKVNLVKYKLKLPFDDKGQQMYCHNLSWQNHEHSVSAAENMTYLKPHVQPVTRKYTVERDSEKVHYVSLLPTVIFEVPLIGDESKDFQYIEKITKRSPKKRHADKLKEMEALALGL